MKQRLIGAALLIALVTLTGCGGSSEPEASPNIYETAPASNAKVFIEGGNNLSTTNSNDITVVEFIDLQSENSAINFTAINELSKKYAGRIKVQIRNFPQEEIHNNSRIAAQAAEAVRYLDKDKYPAFVNMVLQNQAEWNSIPRPEAIVKFTDYAKAVHLDGEQFKGEIESERVRNGVEKDRLDAADLKLSGSPSIYLNGERLLSNMTTDQIQIELDTLLSK